MVRPGPVHGLGGPATTRLDPVGLLLRVSPANGLVATAGVRPRGQTVDAGVVASLPAALDATGVPDGVAEDGRVGARLGPCP